MTTSREIVLIGGVVGLLKEFGSWCGETHIQKTCFVAKVLRNVPFESDFVLYKHGPFLFDLNSSLSEMRSRSILSYAKQGSYGATYDVNRAVWSAFDKAIQNYFDSYREDVRAICEVLARKNVSELERVSAAIYVNISFPNLGEVEKIDKLVELKPHIPSNVASVAFEEAAALRH